VSILEIIYYSIHSPQNSSSSGGGMFMSFESYQRVSRRGGSYLFNLSSNTSNSTSFVSQYYVEYFPSLYSGLGTTSPVDVHSFAGVSVTVNTLAPSVGAQKALINKLAVGILSSSSNQSHVKGGSSGGS